MGDIVTLCVAACILIACRSASAMSFCPVSSSHGSAADNAPLVNNAILSIYGADRATIMLRHTGTTWRTNIDPARLPSVSCIYNVHLSKSSKEELASVINGHFSVSGSANWAVSSLDLSFGVELYANNSEVTSIYGVEYAPQYAVMALVNGRPVAMTEGISRGLREWVAKYSSASNC
jgi:hypothetical protein